MANNYILIVDDDPGSIQLLGRLLSAVAPLRFATGGEDALRLALESLPDLILLDAEMPGMSGFDVLDALRAEPELRDVPVMLVTSHCEPAFEVAGFEKGAADFIAKPVSGPLVIARVMRQLRFKRMADELRRIATVDVLTDVANRRRFDEALEREWRRARRHGSPLALLMIDVDHFKRYNDRYGHQAGDACLQSIANALVDACTRPADLVARYGGEEFVVLLPQTARAGARSVADRVLAAVEALDIPHQASVTARQVTVSIGIATYDEQSGCWVPPSDPSRYAEDLRVQCTSADLMRAADRALYAAKNGGRARFGMLDVDEVRIPQLDCGFGQLHGNEVVTH